MFIDIFSDARLIHNMIDIRTRLHITYIQRKKRTELQTIQTSIHKEKNYNNNNAIENY